jgi:hypothetical protein
MQGYTSNMTTVDATSEEIYGAWVMMDNLISRHPDYRTRSCFQRCMLKPLAAWVMLEYCYHTGTADRHGKIKPLYTMPARRTPLRGVAPLLAEVVWACFELRVWVLGLWLDFA